jgi:hypothetical protein
MTRCYRYTLLPAPVSSKRSNTHMKKLVPKHPRTDEFGAQGLYAVNSSSACCATGWAVPLFCRATAFSVRWPPKNRVAEALEIINFVNLNKILNRLKTLTPREHEVLNQVVSGRLNKEIKKLLAN